MNQAAAAGGSIGNTEGVHALRSRRKHSIQLQQQYGPGHGSAASLSHPSLAVTAEPAFDGAEDLPSSTALLSTASYDENTATATTVAAAMIPPPSPTASTGNNTGMKINPQSNPRAQPLAQVPRPPKPPVSPDLQLTCTDNRVWRGVGGGLFSSLASVSPALSYYLGGTAVWAVQQTWRVISDQVRTYTFLILTLSLTLFSFSLLFPAATVRPILLPSHGTNPISRPGRSPEYLPLPRLRSCASCGQKWE